MRSVRRLLILSGLASTSLLVACPGDYVTNPFAPMALELFLSPSVQTIFVPDTIPKATPVKLDLLATTMGLSIKTPKGVVWESSDPSVAYLDTTGAIYPAKLGTTEVTARINLTRATATVVVAIQATHVTITPSVFVGHVDDTLTVTASALDDANVLVPGMAYSFSSVDPTAATVTRTGNRTAFVRLLRVGTARISATSGGHTATSTGAVVP